MDQQWGQGHKPENSRFDWTSVGGKVTTLQAAARTELIHGPNDGGHFNRRGYTVLGELLARALEAGRAVAR